jgi:hypothetical protein
MSAQLKPTTKRPRRRKGKGVAAMLQAEFPDILRVLLDNAKQGDVRAATLIVKLVDSLSPEEKHDFDSDSLFAELERDLRSLPGDVMSEMVGLLEEAQATAESGPASAGPPSHRGGVPPGRLPWQADDSASDQGEDQV